MFVFRKVSGLSGLRTVSKKPAAMAGWMQQSRSHMTGGDPDEEEGQNKIKSAHQEMTSKTQGRPLYLDAQVFYLI